MQAPTLSLRMPPEQQMPRFAALGEHEQLGLYQGIQPTDSTTRKLLLFALSAPPEQQVPHVGNLGEHGRGLAARAPAS